MIYLWAGLSAFVIFAMVLCLLFLIIKWHDLGYLKVFLGMIIFFSALFIPLFYGSFGVLYHWPKAALVYSYSWVSFPLGVVLFYVWVFMNK